MGNLDGVAAPVAAVSLVLLIIVSALALRGARTKRTAPSGPAERAERSKARRDAWRRGLSITALGAGCVMLFAIAGTAGWLSFAAQRGYAFSRNGQNWDAATGFALLLDAGTLGLSLFRFFEALTLRSSALTRLLLVAFVGASAQMNYLHAPASESGVVDFGSRFVAVIPPLVYAVLLEMLLFKVEQVIMGKRPKRRKDRERGYSLLLWIPFVGYPREMWKAWRQDLHRTLENVRAPGSLKPPITQQVSSPARSETERAAPHYAQQELPTPRREVSPLPEPGELVHTEPPTLTPSTTSNPAISHTSGGTATSERLTRSLQTTPTSDQVAPKRPSLKHQLFEGLVQEMRSGVWDAVSEDPIARTAAWVRVNERLGQERGEETLLAYNSARNAFRDLTADLQAAAVAIRSELRDAAVHQRPIEGPAADATALRERIEAGKEQTVGLPV